MRGTKGSRIFVAESYEVHTLLELAKADYSTAQRWFAVVGGKDSVIHGIFDNEALQASAFVLPFPVN